MSVIICSHNPREYCLRRTIDSIRKQTLLFDKWELLLIDNASNESLADKWDLSWHPLSRHIRECELGLTPARLRGIRDSCGELLVFVDDDNVLAPDYLSTAFELAQKHLFLGALGGNILPEYESDPPHWLLQYERIFAIRKVEKPRWSNAWDDWQSQPWGAGMVVRRDVCLEYLGIVENDQRRKGMDRRGQSLFSGGDTDMVMRSIDKGLGFGVFPQMVVTHLIPSSRMERSYILRLIRGLTASNLWLRHLYGFPVQLNDRKSWYTHLRSYWHFIKRPSIVREIEEAVFAGQQDFQYLLDQNRPDADPQRD